MIFARSDKVFVCPFNSSHEIKREKWSNHLKKCAKAILRDPKSPYAENVFKFTICHYNDFHIVESKNMLFHLMHCEDNNLKREIGMEKSGTTYPKMMNTSTTQELRDWAFFLMRQNTYGNLERSHIDNMFNTTGKPEVDEVDTTIPKLEKANVDVDEAYDNTFRVLGYRY